MIAPRTLGGTGRDRLNPRMIAFRHMGRTDEKSESRCVMPFSLRALRVHRRLRVLRVPFVPFVPFVPLVPFVPSVPFVSFVSFVPLVPFVPFEPPPVAWVSQAGIPGPVMQ